MYVQLTDKAIKQFDRLPVQIQKKARKQFGYLNEDFRHPSLNAKLYTGTENLWQARIDKSYRFYFYIIDPNYVVISLINHPK